MEDLGEDCQYPPSDTVAFLYFIFAFRSKLGTPTVLFISLGIHIYDG